MLNENEDAASKTVDARVLTDTQTDRHIHTQTDRHDRFYDSCPSLMGNYNKTMKKVVGLGFEPTC